MKLSVKEPFLTKKVFVLAILLLFGLILRSNDLGRIHNVDSDERLWVMAGTSLLEKGVPTAWTIMWDEHAWGSYWQVSGGVVTPWLDHPPLFFVMVGGWAYLIGQTDLTSLDWALLRLPMVAVSIASMVFTYLFVKRIFNERLAFFTLLAFVFFPASVISARFILPESVIALFLIVSLYLLAVYGTTKHDAVKKLVMYLLMALCFMSPILKLSGAIIPATVALVFFLLRKYRVGLLMAIGAVLSLSFYLLYAWSYSWEVFKGAQLAHVSRPHTLAHFWTIFTSLDVGNAVLFDESIIVGIVGLLILMVVEKKELNKLLLFAPVFVISFLFLYVAPVEVYGWYKYVLYPLIAIGMGFSFLQLYEGKKEYLFLFLPLLSMMMLNSGILTDLSDRKMMMIGFYVLTALSFFIKRSFKPVFLSLLLFLFFFEVVWLLKVVGVG